MVLTSPILVSAQLPTSSLPDRHSTIQKRTPIPPTVSFVAGGVAGGVEAAATYPFEFAKTRVQLANKGPVPTNPLSVIAHVVRNDGIRAVYTGCSTLILGTTFKASIRFLSYDSIKNLLVDSKGHLSPLRGLGAGMVAGCVESIVAVTPTERLKTALIDDAKGPKRFKGGVQAALTILREGGLRGMYRGLVSTTAKQSATSAVRMGSYNMLRESGRRFDLPNTSVTTFGIGAIAGVITVYATQPLDTVKTRTQSAKGASTGEAIRDVFRTGGVKGFWSGSTMRLGRLVLSGGIVFTVYEQVASTLAPSAGGW